jgi:hypothetical protein
LTLQCAAAALISTPEWAGDVGGAQLTRACATHEGAPARGQNGAVSNPDKIVRMQVAAYAKQ